MEVKQMSTNQHFIIRTACSVVMLVGAGIAVWAALSSQVSVNTVEIKHNQESISQYRSELATFREQQERLLSEMRCDIKQLLSDTSALKGRLGVRPDGGARISLAQGMDE